MINLSVAEDELTKRRQEEEGKKDKAYKPGKRDRTVSKALKAYASMVSSADQGAVRIIN